MTKKSFSVLFVLLSKRKFTNILCTLENWSST